MGEIYSLCPSNNRDESIDVYDALEWTPRGRIIEDDVFMFVGYEKSRLDDSRYCVVLFNGNLVTFRDPLSGRNAAAMSIQRVR